MVAVGIDWAAEGGRGILEALTGLLARGVSPFALDFQRLGQPSSGIDLKSASRVERGLIAG